jgi:hypothetical protein
MSTTSQEQIKIIETPRDGMQGVKQFIPTHKKIEFINLLLQCGFDTVEVGSFVSPRAIPQMKDTAEVLENLDLSNTNSDIAVLVVNEKGGEKVVQYDFVDQLFFPFSVSPTFIQKNLNTTIEDAEKTMDKSDGQSGAETDKDGKDISGSEDDRKKVIDLEKDYQLKKALEFLKVYKILLQN